VACKNVGTLLRADRQRIAKSARDRQQDGLALAFEQGVGGDGRADANVGRRQWPMTHPCQPPDRLNRRVVVMPRIIRQQFGSVHRAIGCVSDDIGERAAAVDPELPAGGHRAPLCRRAASTANRLAAYGELTIARP